MTHPFTTALRLALVTVLTVSAAGCGVMGNGPSCTGFALSIAVQGGGAASPFEAARQYAQDEGHLPTTGWTTVETTDSGVSLRSGESRLHAMQLRDGTWIIDSGRRC